MANQFRFRASATALHRTRLGGELKAHRCEVDRTRIIPERKRVMRIRDSFLHRVIATPRVLVSRNGALVTSGWWRSRRSGEPLDESGRPIPWLNYSAIQFLEQVLVPSDRVFEYGAGNSSVWFSERTASVTSVEGDARWAEYLEQRGLPDVRIVVSDPADTATYVRRWNDFGRDCTVAVIDGRHRARCVENMLANPMALRWIVLDDAEREHYAAAVTLIRGACAESWHFRGLKPGHTRESWTMFGRLESNHL